MKIDEALKRRLGSIPLPFGAWSRAFPASERLLSLLRAAPFPPPREGEKMEATLGEQQGEPGACDSHQLTRGQEATSLY